MPHETPLLGWHVAHGARLVDFAGWRMPIQYTSIVAEHRATRAFAGLFDISHMGRLEFRGGGARGFLEGLLTRRVSDMTPGMVRYALVTNDAGGVLDDVLVYCLEEKGAPWFLLVVNASNREKILQRIEPRLAGADVKFKDRTHDWGMIALQGPDAQAMLTPLAEGAIGELKNYRAMVTRVMEHRAIVSRTGYTGEDGFEIIVDKAATEGVWERLIQADASPVGLGARDTLRIEAAMPLYGHELSEEIDPITAGLDFAVDLKDRQFPGRDALQQLQGKTALRRIGLALSEKRVPREGYAVFAGEKQIGHVTSGTFSPLFERPIAMAYVDVNASLEGVDLEVDIRGSRASAKLSPLPFYSRKSRSASLTAMAGRK